MVYYFIWEITKNRYFFIKTGKFPMFTQAMTKKIRQVENCNFSNHNLTYKRSYDNNFILL